MSETLDPIEDINDLTYSIGDTPIELHLNIATLSLPSCASVITYQMLDINSNALPNPPFSFDSINRIFTIESTSDSSVTGIYDIRYIITNTHGGL